MTSFSAACSWRARQVGFGQRDQRRSTRTWCAAKTSLPFRKPALMFSGAAITRGQASEAHVAAQERGQGIDHRRDSRSIVRFSPQQFAVVARHAFHRVAAVHRAAALAVFAALLFGRVGRELDVARVEAHRVRKPIQNWCVDHMFSTRGRPTRMCSRGP